MAALPPSPSAVHADGGRCNVHGAAIAYRLQGPVDAPVLMLGNSLAADLEMWDGNLPALGQHFRVLRYDMRGHGASSTPAGPYTLELLADDAIALLDALRIDKVHFVGVSLGGMVAQQLAARYPNRIASVVLCATMSNQAAPAAWDERMAAVRRGGMEAIAEATLQRWFTPAFHAEAPQALAAVRRMVLATRPEGYLGCAAAIRALAQDALLPRIAGPCLVLAGEHDGAATPAIAQSLAQRIPGAQLHVVPGAAHLPNIERQAAFDARVLAFLADATAATGR
ncbi:3-oxoadipate enol-lactonase [Ramlibacter sp. MAH-25]|uniref:3-oxoadipate enol-lactonase n=1 Tax=Ramlibacter pinisoli TaxID=2682844 RepID=A0A6N8IUB9_9BURK|nr:3-oxoadipate enol-lactonase [Ramlibacter sp. CGMCC 1.13660]MVQ30504.1 3-oxoadipate enol-lactonase [Ramlibacter pinisoli]